MSPGRLEVLSVVDRRVHGIMDALEYTMGLDYTSGIDIKTR